MHVDRKLEKSRAWKYPTSRLFQLHMQATYASNISKHHMQATLQVTYATNIDAKFDNFVILLNFDQFKAVDCIYKRRY